MYSLKLFITVATCLFLFACDSGECDAQKAEPEATNPASVEVMVNFMLVQSKTANLPMYVTGRTFRAGTNEKDVKPVKCIRSPISDSQKLLCSLGGIPTSSDIRFMVNVPTAGGDDVPACATKDPNGCLGIVKVTLAEDPFVPPVTLVADWAFKSGVAYRVLIPTPHAL